MTAFLTVLEFAEELRVDKTVVHRLIKDKKITAINVGTPKRVRLRVASSQLAAAEKTLAVKA